MTSEFDTDTLREQPLSVDEKQVLSEYFQLEGRRQFENYQSLFFQHPGVSPDLFDLFDYNHQLLEELSDKKLTLELSRRDHWISLMKSIHNRFYEGDPARPEILLWFSICLEKHSILQVETGQEEYRPLMREAQRRQMPLIQKLGEFTVKQLVRDIELFYDLLDIDALTENLLRL